MYIKALHLLGAVGSLLIAAQWSSGFTAQDIPPIHRSKSSSDNLRHGYQSGTIRSLADTGVVTITWTASAVQNEEPDWSLLWDGGRKIGPHKFRMDRQELQADFFVTATAVVDHQTILVGGVTATGETVVEKWGLTWPNPMPVPKYNTRTGVSSVSPVLVGRSSTQRIFSSSQAGMHLPRSLSTLRIAGAAAEKYLVQFDDSGDVCALPLDGIAAPELIAGSGQGGTLGVVAGLVGYAQSGIDYGDHMTHGFAYEVIRRVGGKLPPTPSPGFPYHVIFVDADRDGVLDGVLELTVSEYETLGWGDLNNYIAPWTY